MNRKLIYVLAGVVVLGLAGYFTFQALNSSLVYFLLPGEYAEQQASYVDRRVRLGGIVAPGTMNMDEENVRLNFVLADSQQGYPVSHAGTPPALFSEGVGVVVEGRFEDGVFHSDSLLVRHSEVYEVDDEGHIDDEALREALK